MSFYLQTKHPGPVFCPFTLQNLPQLGLWVQQSGSREHIQLYRCAVQDSGWFYPVLGGYPSTNWIFFMPESAQWQQGRAQVTGFVRRSQRALGCLVIFCLFAAFGFGGIGPVWALRDQNYFLPVIKSLCTLRVHIKWLKKRIWIKLNLKALMGCDHSRTPSREYVAKEKKNHPKMSLIS